MKKLICLLLLISSASFAKDSDSAYDRVIAKNEIVCGIWAWAPYKELDPNTKEWKGFAIDIYRQAFATLDMKITFKEVVLGDQVQDLNSGRIDAICDDGPYILSAGKFVEYSDPVYASTVYPYVRKEEKRFNSRNDFNNENVQFTGIDGDISSDMVRRLFPKAKFLSMPSTTDVSQLFLNIVTKKADIALVDPGAFITFNKGNPDKLKPLFKNNPLGKYKVVISVKKGDLKMLGLVNQAIDNAHAFGIIDEILDNFDPKHENILRVRCRYTFN